MSTILESYCNTTTDLQAIVSNINTYDQKRIIGAWTTPSTNLYKAGSVGNVEMLYRNNLELGAPESVVGDVDADGEWFYDSSLDELTLYSTSTPVSGALIEAGQDWSTVKTEAVARASEFVRSYLSNKQIISREGTNTESESLRDYEDNIIQATAHLACSMLVKHKDPELSTELRSFAIDLETKFGILNLIKSGELKLWNEVSINDNSGIVKVVSRNASSTGTIIDTKGVAVTEFDLIKVVIDTGGTFSPGSASGVIYSTYIGDSTGLKTVIAVNSETIDGAYQYIGHGLYVRFSPGVYTTNDEWEVEARGTKPESGSGIKSIRAVRV